MHYFRRTARNALSIANNEKHTEEEELLWKVNMGVTY